MSINREFNLTGTLTGEFTLQLDFSESEGMRRILMPLIDKKLEITFKELEYKRSDAQNRYYWGVVIPTIRAFLRETEGVPYTKNQVHFFNLYNVQEVKPEIVTICGKDTIVMEAKKSSEMTTKEFKEFVECLQAYWGERECYIPDPVKFNFITDFIQ